MEGKAGHRRAAKRNGFINKIKKQNKEEEDEPFNDFWAIALDLACSGVQRQFPTYIIKEKGKQKSICPSKKLK